MKLSVLLEHNQIFHSLSTSEQQEIAYLGIERTYKKGECVTRQGDIWPFLFLIEKGSINAIKASEEGRNLVAATLGEGDVFWGLAFYYDDAPMPASLEVFEDTRIHIWGKETLKPMILRNGEIAWELSRLMIQRMIKASEVLEEMTFQPVAVRLARLLLNISKSEEKVPIERNLSLDEMASRIGSTREMVCRFLHRFADDGLIDIRRTDFAITDKKSLTTLAQKEK